MYKSDFVQGNMYSKVLSVYLYVFFLIINSNINCTIGIMIGSVTLMHFVEVDGSYLIRGR